jgi:hypothetical protein
VSAAKTGAAVMHNRKITAKNNTLTFFITSPPFIQDLIVWCY